MAQQIRLTKTELRSQQLKLLQLRKYLPTLQLKKSLLQLEVDKALYEIAKRGKELAIFLEKIEGYVELFSDTAVMDLFSSVSIQSIQKQYENIAGLEIPVFQSVVFSPMTISLFDTPVWLDPAIVDMKNFISVRERLVLLNTMKDLLEKELRDVSIRVNLFEKVLIPRAQANIKKIKIFLGDLQLAAVAQTKVAKRKILQKKEAAR